MGLRRTCAAAEGPDLVGQRAAVSHSSAVRPPILTNAASVRTAAIGQVTTPSAGRDAAMGRMAASRAAAMVTARWPDSPKMKATFSCCQPM